MKRTIYEAPQCVVFSILLYHHLQRLDLRSQDSSVDTAIMIRSGMGFRYPTGTILFFTASTRAQGFTHTAVDWRAGIFHQEQIGWVTSPKTNPI
jgi:hypothetical protein